MKEKLSIIVLFIIILVFCASCIGSMGSSGKKSSSSDRYGYITNSDGTRTWYDKNNKNIVVIP